MIPILYERTEETFTSNGLGRLADCLSCIVTEERNGIYECTFQYPVNGEMFSQLVEGRIIGVIHDDVKDIQPFDIYAHSAPLDGVVTFYARHVSYRLGNIILKPMSATSCVAALSAIPNNTYNRCPFSFWTDKAVSGTWENKVPSAVKTILGGQQGSILDVYGKGEYQWDKFLVRLYVNRGADNGVSIRYGVNLTKLEQNYDKSGSYNAAAPYWVNSEDGTVVTLSNGIVVSDADTTFLVPWTTDTGIEITDNNGNVIQFRSADITPVPMDLSDAFDEAPTEAQLKAEALRRMNNAETWLPSENITVSFVNLADTEEYKNVAALQRVSLCDKVSVYCGPLGVSAAKMQVIRVVYNVLTERYDEIELGKAKTTFAETITKAVTAQIEEATKNLPSVSMMQDAIDNATQQITGANGGHVRFIYDANGDMQEIVIMDTDDISTAVNVWRFNAGGFGFSSHGYAGPYTTAITQDGQIVADFITAGAINAGLITVGNLIADIIKGGTLTLGGNNNSDGLLNVKNSSGNIIGSWGKDGISILNGDIEGSTIKLGGNNNSYGKLEMISGSGVNNGGWDVNGITVGGTNNSQSQIGFNRYDSGETAAYFRLETYARVQTDEKCQRLYLYVNKGQSGNAQTMVIFDGGAPLENKAPQTEFETKVFIRQSDLEVNSGNLIVSGTKSRAVATDQYSNRLLYCYEIPSPMFGDVGEGTIGEDGKCYVWLDPVFAQTITTTQYQVFLQRYGSGECWVSERNGNYFVIDGTPNMAFGWEIKAKQKDFDQLRLDRNDEPFIVPPQTYGEDAAKYIDDLKKERISA